MYAICESKAVQARLRWFETGGDRILSLEFLGGMMRNTCCQEQGFLFYFSFKEKL